MPTQGQIVLGDVPDPLLVNLTAGSPFVTSLRRNDGEPWPEDTELELRLGTHVWAATLTGSEASWDVAAASVDAALTQRRAQLWLNGSLWAAGPVVAR